MALIRMETEIRLARPAGLASVQRSGPVRASQWHRSSAEMPLAEGVCPTVAINRSAESTARPENGAWPQNGPVCIRNTLAGPARAPICSAPEAHEAVQPSRCISTAPARQVAKLHAPGWATIDSVLTIQCVQ